MENEIFEETIKNIEEYYLGEGEECGEKLFIEFARKYKDKFLNSRVNNSSENDFE